MLFHPDAKTVERIKRLSPQQITDLEPRHIKKLTHDFEEQYARMIVEKVSSPQDQAQLLYVLKKTFNDLYYEGEWNGEYQYSRDYPTYFDRWDTEITLDGGIAPGELMPWETEVAPAPTLTEMLGEEGHLATWMNLITKDLVDSQRKAREDAESILSQVKSLRDGSLARLQKKLEEMQSENAALREELAELRRWREEWEELRRSVVIVYDDEDIVSEIGGLSDRDLMEEMLEAVCFGRELAAENKRLRQSQEAWRESPEYKDEKEKWEKIGRKSIRVEDMKNLLLGYVQSSYMGSGESLEHWVNTLCAILRGTAWDALVNPTQLLAEVRTAYRKANRNQEATVNNYFGSGSSAQQFNGPTTGQFNK